MSNLVLTPIGRVYLFAPWIFYTTAIVIWLILLGPYYALENVAKNFNISLTMAIGSFVAGGTALGGGAVAFPVLTKLFGVSTLSAKLFSLAIQSFGMTSASLTILYKKIPFYKDVALLTIAGSIPGAIVGLEYVSPNISDLLSKVIFSLFLASFGLTLYYKLKTNSLSSRFVSRRFMTISIPIIGFLGGTVSGTLGSGADILIFAALVLFFKAELAAATATSVLVMAVTSVFSAFYSLMITNTLTPEILQLVYACIPIVILGAPLGAMVCIRIKPASLVGFLLALIILDVVSTTVRITAEFL